MPRALWKGAISYGLVHIPVELISGSLDHELDLPGTTFKAVGISDKELKMALSLAEGMSEQW